MSRFRLFVAILFAALLLAPAGASAADKIATPGPFTAEITGGQLAIKELVVPIEEINPAPTISGTIAGNGDIVIPSSGVNFPPLQFDLDGNAIDVYVMPSGTDWTGNLDPYTGEFTLNARLRVRAAGTPLGVSLGNNCFVGAAGTGNNVHLDPATTGSIPANGVMPAMTGTPYNQDAGTVTVVNNTVSAPAATDCGLATSIVNSELGLPSASGNNSAALDLKFTSNAPKQSVVSRFTTDPSIGRVPFDVDFDASASTSVVGPITSYGWDFDGDGNVDETTEEPTVTHRYEVPGMFHPRLTVTSEDIVTTASTASVEARAIIVTYTEKPPSASTARDADFAFEANESPATFECRLDVGETEGDYEPCESPVSFTDLPDNDYRYYVRAIAEDESVGLPAVWDFRVDNINPVASVTGKPADTVPASVTSGQVSFTANEVVTFECRYTPATLPGEDPGEEEGPEDPGEEPEPDDGFGPCESPTDVEWDVIDGFTNTFEIRPTDRAGNVGDVVTASWTVDTTPPTANVTGTPTPSPTNLIGGVNTRMCPAGTGLAELACTLGVVDWVDTPNPGNNPGQSWSFNSNEPNSTFICQFNNNDERPCASGIQTGLGIQEGQPSGAGERRLGNPTEGVNTLRIWATDAAGNRQGDPTVSTYVYDTTPPVLTAMAKPAEFTKNTTNTVIFQSNEPVQTNSFQCRFINNTGTGTTSFATGTGAPSGFVPCDPGQLSPTQGWYQVHGQTEGRKGVQVRATDLAGNVLNTNNNVLNNGGLTVYWTVDNTAPTAAFAAGSQQQGSFTTSSNATINLSATDAPINFGTTANGITAQQPSYECSLNGAAFAACSTPVNLTDLTPGAKSFRVRVTDQATNLSAIIERNWTVVDDSNASVEITDAPDDVIGVRDANFEFTPDLGTAQCRIDPTEANNLNDTGWVACASGHGYIGLADGVHTVQIRADVGQVPAIHTFAVYANLPTASYSSRPGISRPAPNAGFYTGLDQNSHSISFTSPANPGFAPGATTHECRYYNLANPEPPFEPCSSPVNVNWNKLNDGATMRFEVRPTSSTGNAGSVVTADWTIVATSPAVALGNPTVTPACGTGAAGGPPGSGCVATASSTQPALLSNVTAPRFQATSSKPITNAIGFACQLNNNPVQNPCTGRTGSFPAGGNPLTVLLGGSRGNNDNLGNAIAQNAENTMRIWAVDLGGNMSEAVTYTWVHDSTAPTFSITSPTPSRTSAQDVEVDITSNEDLRDVDGFRCRLIPGGTATTNPTNPSGWPTCTERSGPRDAKWIGEDLAEGNYVLDIRGYDMINNVNTSTNAAGRPTETDGSTNGRRYIFTVDRTAPVTTINGGPANASTVGQKDATFTWTTNEAANTAGSECRIDPEDPEDLSEGWEPCASGIELTDLEDGEHVFQVRSWDDLDNRAVTPAQRTWSIDSTQPEIELKSSLDSDLTNETSVTIGHLVDPDTADVECRLITPADREAPEEGEEPTEVEWTNDCGELIVPEPPEEDPESEDPPADPEDPDPFKYIAYVDLEDGDYTFQIRATNGLGVVSDTSELDWTVDTEAPDLSIDNGPAENTNQTTAEIEFSSSDDSATFSCVLDEGDAEDCESPVSYNSLEDGEHTFEVTATDAAGNVSDPVSHSWSIDTVAPVTQITSGPTGTVDVADASFAFSADKAGSTFECKLDSGAWEACTSPKAVSGLANGQHTISIKATDTLGNVGDAVDRTWTVNVVTPTCPDGQVGTPPNCEVPQCPAGQIGTPPNCENPPVGEGKLANPKLQMKKRVKGGKQVKATVTLTNVGDAALSSVKVCLKTKKRTIAGKANRCKTVASIAAGASRKVSFKLKAKKVAKNLKSQVNVVVTHKGADATTKTVRGKGHVTVLK